MCTSYFSRNLEEARVVLEFIFFVSQKFVIYKILNTLKLFWFTIDSSVLLNEGVQFFFHGICHFCLFVLLLKIEIIQKNFIKVSRNISAHLSMKIILVDPNLMRTFFGNNFFYPDYGAHP